MLRPPKVDVAKVAVKATDTDAKMGVLGVLTFATLALSGAFGRIGLLVYETPSHGHHPATTEVIL